MEDIFLTWVADRDFPATSSSLTFPWAVIIGIHPTLVSKLPTDHDTYWEGELEMRSASESAPEMFT
jgi:hypothetical protein